jgi:hypothetical protein
MSVGDDLYIGDSVFISGNAYVNDIVSGIGNNLNISTGDINNDLNITSGYVVITTNGLIIKNTSGNDNVIFNTTSSSFNNAVYLNNTSGSGIESNSLVASGSVSFNSTNNSTSATSGGCLTIAGGVGINKDLRLGGALYTNDNIHLLNNNSTLGSFSVISNGSLLFNCSNTFRFNNADMLISKGSLQLNEYMLTSTNGNLNIEKSSLNEWKTGQIINNDKPNIYPFPEVKNNFNINSVQSLNIVTPRSSEIYEKLLVKLAEANSRQDLLIARKEIQASGSALNSQEKIALSDIYKVHLQRVKLLEDSLLGSPLNMDVG